MSNASGLENLTIWLWDNAQEGLHITMTTNYNLPTEKRWFFSYGGAQTKNSWLAYDRSQPPNLKEWFREQKQRNFEIISAAKQTGYTVYISKQTRNTGTKGRVVAQGFCATFMPSTAMEQPQFILKMQDLTFKGEFDSGALSNAQRNKGCLGVYKWSAVEEEVSGVAPW